MNRCWRALIATAAASALSLPAAAQDIPSAAPVQLEPAGPWRVEYADWQCILHRQLASAGKQALFSLTLEPLTSVAWMRVAIEGSGGRRADGEAVMLADGQRRPGALHYNAFNAGSHRMREFMLDQDRHALGAVKERIRFWTKAHGDIEMHVAGFQPAWAALGTCMSDLYAELGIPEGDIARMATKPEGHFLSFVKFPDTSRLEFALLYWVTAEGRVDDCRLLKPSGFAAFDQSLCSEIKAKARLKPATDAAGNPIRVPRFENVNIRRVTFTTSSPLPGPRK